jgi:hypothetical protein
MESRVDIRDPALSTSAINGSNERSRMRPRYAIQFQRVWLTRYYLKLWQSCVRVRR